MNKVLWGLFLLSLAVLAWWYQRVSTFEHRVVTRTLERVQVSLDEQLSAFETRLDTFFAESEQSVDALAALINRKRPAYRRLIPAMKKVLKQPQCTAIGAHFADAYDKKPLAHFFAGYTYKDKTKTLYAPFFTKAPRKTRSFPYDYTLTGPDAKNTGWYSESLDRGSWYGPYFGQANGKFLISYRTPIEYDVERQKNLGNIVADYSLENLKDFLAGVQLLDSGYGIIVTADGTVVSHPVNEYLGRNIADVEDLDLTIEQLGALSPGRFHELKNAESGRERLIYTRSFSARGWKILAVLNKDDTLVVERNGEKYTYQAVLHRMRVIFILLSALSLFCLSLLLVYRHDNRDWYISGSFSLLCLIAIILIWYIHLTAHRRDDVGNIVVSTKTDLEAALNSFHRAAVAGSGDSGPGAQVRIRTGFFVQSVKFSSANDIFITGYAWQKMPPQWQAKMHKGEDASDYLQFVLPEAESATVDLIYADKEVARWYFEASLRQSFNYLKFPFDDEDIWVRARFREFYQNDVILVPDFDAYPNFEESLNNGLANDIFIEGWNIENTYFYFKKINYSSNFGVPGADRSLRGKPDLYFDLSISREFLGVFVAYMIPLAVIAYLLFAVLMIRTRDSGKNELFGFNSATVLAYAASLFFVLIVSHMSLRETLQAKGIIYLEYFFFILYIAIAAVAANSIAFSYKRIDQGISDKWPTLSYWPLLLLSILIITIMRFS